MSNELLAAFGITDEDLKEAKEEKKISSARTEKKEGICSSASFLWGMQTENNSGRRNYYTRRTT